MKIIEGRAYMADVMPENYTDMDLEGIFSVSGRLAMAAMCSDATDAALRNYESRPQQIEMAHAVERAIETDARNAPKAFR